MNKYEEALNTLTCKAESDDWFCDANKNKKRSCCLKCNLIESVELLQELVEKATPKKAILVHDYDGYVYECPNCHNDFRPNYFADNITWKGCPYCLQALNWGEEE